MTDDQCRKCKSIPIWAGARWPNGLCPKCTDEGATDGS